MSLECKIILENIENSKKIKKYENYFCSLKNENISFRNTHKNISIFILKISEIEKLEFKKNESIIQFVSY